MLEKNKTIVRRFFELLNRDQDLPGDLLGSGFTYHVAGSPSLDIKATHQRMGVFRAAFSDIKHVEEEMVAEGDRVAFRTRLEMIHKGEFMGIAGSDTQISVVEMGVMRIANGKVAEMWGILDMMGIMQQLGALPSPKR
jgi:predicted ester cyclase